MTQINEFLQMLINSPFATLLIILNICFLEIILSIDNASVLAIMVKDLPKDKQNKALKYGIVGAYVFRGLALLFVSFLIKIWWLKPLGGLYLLYLAYKYFKGKSTENTKDDELNKNNNLFYKMTVGWMGIFWSTVVMVEIIDLSFSIDNIFAVVAFSPNIIMICIGVFVGILAMRFVAMKFVILMEKYPFLETAAFVVIAILGLKLFSSLLVHYCENLKWIESETFDWIMSGVTLLVFFVPLAYNKFIKKA